MKESSAYFDYAAATPLSDVALRAMTPYFSEKFYNPSSPYAPAVHVRREFEQAKAAIAAVIGAKPSDIIMTAGATESINLALHLGARGHIVSAQNEHDAVMNAARQYSATFVAPRPDGVVDVAAIRAAVQPDTILISLAAANNETGTVQPLRQVAALVAEVRTQRATAGNPQPLYLHSDASQAAGLLDLHVSRLGVDLLTLNAAKVYGPKQVGLLWRNSQVALEPLLHGGGQEMNLRSGTENVAGTIGFAAALRDAESKRSSETARLSALRDRLEQELLRQFADAQVLGSTKKRLANFCTIAFAGLDAERVVFLLENQHIYVATGSACAANKATRSHVLTAMGLPPEVSDGSIRFSLGRPTTQQELDRALPIIVGAIRSEYERTRV